MFDKHKIEQDSNVLNFFYHYNCICYRGYIQKMHLN